MDYESKYLKYKHKYLDLVGGAAGDYMQLADADKPKMSNLLGILGKLKLDATIPDIPAVTDIKKSVDILSDNLVAIQIAIAGLKAGAPDITNLTKELTAIKDLSSALE